MKAASMSMLAGLALIGGALWAASAGVGDGSGADSRFEQYDRDGDGVISRAEAAAVSAGLETHFGKFDRNGDGVLAYGEFRGRGERALATE